MAPSRPLEVYLEAGSRRVFACALAWPGWCRSARDDEAALAALAEYEPRYRLVCERAGVTLPRAAGQSFEVVERLAGSATTDFGAPDAVPAADHRRLTPAAARRNAALVAASWALLESVAATAPPTLRKGPRGGGRDRDAIVGHVDAAEASYARKVGVAHRDTAERRAALLAVLGQPSTGDPPVDRGWPVGYAARRIAWHVLDHAWEIEDRST